MSTVPAELLPSNPEKSSDSTLPIDSAANEKVLLNQWIVFICMLLTLALLSYVALDQPDQPKQRTIVVEARLQHEYISVLELKNKLNQDELSLNDFVREALGLMSTAELNEQHLKRIRYIEIINVTTPGHSNSISFDSFEEATNYPGWSTLSDFDGVFISVVLYLDKSQIAQTQLGKLDDNDSL